ncbi:MAG: T9SS type A sorting domain-containing protein, partial [Ignavibacteria bacterium]|nr:T9SS type A sorting domain-containing protein [Ignavibacteria bacterium]
MMQPGEYDVKFGNDNLELVSGVYYYQLQVNNFVETKKMILLK